MINEKPKLKRRVAVSIIGAGRLGSALAMAMEASGYRIEALVARRLAHARRSADLLDVSVMALGARQLAQLPASELVIIATPDDQIEQVARSLAGRRLPRGKTRTALHTSGALSSAVLVSLTERGWHCGSIHPLIAVSDSKAGAGALRDRSWCIEGDKQAIRVARRLVYDLGGKSFSIGPEQKPLYHAAAVMSSGHVVALFDVALTMLSQCGLTAADAQKTLVSLISSAVTNLKTNEPAAAMTGPFARGDLATLARHLRALSDKRLSDASQLYRLLGQRAVILAGKQGLDPKILKQMKKMLDGE